LTLSNLKRLRKNLKINLKHQTKTKLQKEKERELVSLESQDKEIKIELLVPEGQDLGLVDREDLEVVMLKEDQRLLKEN